MILASSCSCRCPIHWSQVLSREWRCSWSSTDRQSSNYIRMINNFIGYWSVTYIRGLTVHILWGILCNMNFYSGLVIGNLRTVAIQLCITSHAHLYQVRVCFEILESADAQVGVVINKIPFNPSTKLETHGWLLSIVATDALVLKH